MRERISKEKTNQQHQNYRVDEAEVRPHQHNRQYREYENIREHAPVLVVHEQFPLPMCLCLWLTEQKREERRVLGIQDPGCRKEWTLVFLKFTTPTRYRPELDRQAILGTTRSSLVGKDSRSNPAPFLLG